MIPIVVAMVVILALAALVLYYVAVPHRGDGAGSGGWLDRAMQRARGSVRTLGEHDEDDDAGSDTGR
ncbi:hypothetical protein BKA08_002559 [Nocardioides marinisabuli]|uniref:Uncharacterized protein n=1 Tax=Nocardioides marinisabuli TaxID=419476 RepID=A0A7Y9F2T1_9ACTN|nr:hypothetical protein [Nocardioides marinisabuli]NYD58321.1 hypothetical protein [Nocardioides marinisabuli]